MQIIKERTMAGAIIVVICIIGAIIWGLQAGKKRTWF